MLTRFLGETREKSMVMGREYSWTSGQQRWAFVRCAEGKSAACKAEPKHFTSGFDIGGESD